MERGDALEPNDEHELQAAAADGGGEPCEISCREGADAEKSQIEHRRPELALDEDECYEQKHADRKFCHDIGIRPHEVPDPPGSGTCDFGSRDSCSTALSPVECQVGLSSKGQSNALED
jgi:hypothetical protein